MAIKIPNEAELILLDSLRVNMFNAATIRLSLFKNNYTVIDATVLADFTKADFTGYADASTLTFGAVVTNVDGKAETDSVVKSFTYTALAGSQTVYGYYLWDNVLNKLILAENFSAPIVLTPILSLLTVQVLATMSSEF